MEGYDAGNEYEEQQSTIDNETNEDTDRNNANGKKSSYANLPRMGLQGKRSRIRFQPYKGLGTRTYKNSVFVSNIAYELTEKQFKELFEEQVGKVSFCEIFPEPDGLSTGCGCVEFENEEDVERSCIVLKKFQVQGRGLIVRDDRDLTFSSRYRPQNPFHPPRQYQQQQQQHQQQQQSSAIVNPQVLYRLGIQQDDVSETIFIANLADEVDLRKLKDVFSLAGLVMNCDILRDDEGKSIGLATVTFSSCDEAVNAVSMFDNQPLFEQKMSVRMNKSKKRQDSSKLSGELPQGLGSIGANLLSGDGVAAGGDRPMNSLMGGGMGGAPGGALCVAPGGGSMYGNRTADYNRGEIHGYDRQYGGMNRGFEMTPDMGYPSDTRGSFGGGPIRGYDVHRGFHQPSPGGDAGTQVFVRNLSSEVTWEDLKDSFKKVGPVFFADIKKDSDGMSRCIGTVKFFNPLHAQQAILLLNGSNMKGRRIGVTMGRF